MLNQSKYEEEEEEETPISLQKGIEKAEKTPLLGEILDRSISTVLSFLRKWCTMPPSIDSRPFS